MQKRTLPQWECPYHLCIISAQISLSFSSEIACINFSFSSTIIFLTFSPSSTKSLITFSNLLSTASITKKL